MKKIIAAVVVTLLMATTGTAAFAAGKVEVNAGLSLGTGPADFDSSPGITFGGGVMILDNPQLQIRGDLSYYEFEASVFGTDVSYKRMPIAGSARMYFPVAKNLRVFGQAGLEFSFDKVEVVTLFPAFVGFTPTFIAYKQTDDEINIGITPGGGIEFMVNDMLGLFAAARWHIISDAYFDLNFGAAVHF